MASEPIRQSAKAVAARLKKGRRPAQAQIPWLTADPNFDEGIVMWMHTDGGLRFYDPTGQVYEATKTSGGTTTSGTGFPADPEPALYTSTYLVTYGRTFCDQHGVETSEILDFGDSPDGAHTGRRIMLGLPDSTIRSDTAGATIDLVELQLVLVSSYQPKVKVHFGLHAQTSAPSTYSAVRKEATLLDYPGADWRKLHAAFGRWLRDDVGRGITIDQPGGVVNSGQIYWAATQLRISYTK